MNVLGYFCGLKLFFKFCAKILQVLIEFFLQMQNFKSIVGDTILEELEARCWSRTDLANTLGLHSVDEIIAGHAKVTPEIAKSLATAFGTSVQFWLNLANIAESL